MEQGVEADVAACLEARSRRVNPSGRVTVYIDDFPSQSYVAKQLQFEAPAVVAVIAQSGADQRSSEQRDFGPAPAAALVERRRSVDRLGEAFLGHTRPADDDRSEALAVARGSPGAAHESLLSEASAPPAYLLDTNVSLSWADAYRRLLSS